MVSLWHAWLLLGHWVTELRDSAQSCDMPFQNKEIAGLE